MRTSFFVSFGTWPMSTVLVVKNSSEPILSFLGCLFDTSAQ